MVIRNADASGSFGRRETNYIQLNGGGGEVKRGDKKRRRLERREKRKAVRKEILYWQRKWFAQVVRVPVPVYSMLSTGAR